MPMRRWRYTCCAEDGEILTTSELCSTCGRPGEYVGWQYDRLESMAVYQNIYGLRPVGPHRALADSVYAECRTRCFYCKGNGLLDQPAENSYAICPMCMGAGYFLSLDRAGADALHARILAEYPDAAAPPRIGDVAGAIIAEDLSKGFVIDAERPEPGDEA